MSMRNFLIALILGATLPISAGAHALLSSEGAQQDSLQSCAETPVATGNLPMRIEAKFAGFSRSTPPSSPPKREDMRRDSSSLAENVLTPLFPSFRDFSMRFTKLRASWGSGIALAVSTLIVGCGGGGSTDSTTDNSTQDSVAASSTSSTSSVSAGNDAGIVATSGSSASTSDVAASASSDSASSASAPTTTVASATDATTTTPVSLAPTSAKGGVGTNLTPVNYYSGQYPTIDFMKKASGWLTQCATWINKDCKTSPWDTGEEAQLDLDANGWIKSLPATGSSAVYRYASTVVTSGGTQPAGKYIVLYDGQGTLGYSGVATKSTAESTPGRDVVNVTNGTAVFLVSVLTTSPSNYLRNIRIYAPGGACSGDMNTYVTSAAACTTGKGSYIAFENFPAGSTWFPTFAGDLKGFRTLRFMDWGMTNTNKVTSWTGRTSPTSRVWSGTTGVPIEAMFDLAKTTGADPWVNIPPYVDDDYIHQFGKLAHQNLAAGETLNLEYGNEMWNYAFPASVWATAQAKAAFPASVAAGVDSNALTRNWYAQRLVQACTIVKGEFGADASRVRCIANTQAANAWDTGEVLACPYAGGACARSIDVVAIAPYFATYIGNASYSATVKTWYTDADGGLSKMFQEIIGNDTTATANVIAPLSALTKSVGGSLAMSKAMMIATKAAAAKYGKPMWAYEGGQSLLPPIGSTDQTLLNLMIAANRDARMGAAYQAMLQDWVAAGGQTFALFTDISPYNTAGFWGMRESQFATAATSPKWKTATQWRDGTACWWSGC